MKKRQPLQIVLSTIALIVMGLSGASAQTLQTYFNFTTYGSVSGGGSITDLTGNTTATVNKDSNTTLTSSGLKIAGGATQNTGVTLNAGSLGSLTGDFTIQTWINLSSLTTDYGFFGGNSGTEGKASTTTNTNFLIAQIRGSDLCAVVNTASSVYGQFQTTSIGVSKNMPSDYVLTYSAASKTFTEYVNGVQAGQFVASSFNGLASIANFAVGGQASSPYGDNSAVGTTSDFLIFNGALSSAQVSAVHNLQPGATVAQIKTALTIPTPTISSFGVAFLPDTQFYCRYQSTFLTMYGTEPYAAQTQWLATYATSLGIPFVAHEGDVVDQESVSASWTVGSNDMTVLETAKVPYSILAGNHDVVDPSTWDNNRTQSSEPFLTHFTASRAATQATFGGRNTSTGFGEYHIFSYQGQKFMSLALGWQSSLATLAWAQSVIQANPTIPVILTTHDAMAIDSDAVTALDDDYGTYLWENLVHNNDQIFMVVNGHNHGSAYKTRQNDFGHTVLQVVVDYQMDYMGGNGYMRLFEFDLTNNLIKGISFSPWVPMKPTSTLNATYDQAVLTDANQQYTVPMNFAQRFAGFDPGFSVGTPNRAAALTDTVTSMILAHYTNPPQPVVVLPYDSDDYPHSSATIVHWRFNSGTPGQSGGTPGQPVTPGVAINDVSGINPVTRVPLANGAQPGDLVWSSDHHALSACAGSIQFAANGNLGSFLVNAANSALSADTLSTGYTIEGIFKIDPNWSASNEAWMCILTRGGVRSNLAGWTGGYDGTPPLAFAISNLREIQFEVSTVPPIQGLPCWSGETMTGQWTHVAVVNDPVTHTLTMYQDGAPVLRNNTGAIGIDVSPNQPWVIGGEVDGEGDPGFFGSIGEIRITKAVLGPNQWLTARKNRVQGTGGRQTLAGTSGDDEIFCNQAACTLTGNGGYDTFVFDSMRDATSTITDFAVGQSKLNIHGVLSSINYAGTDPLADGTVKFVDSAKGAVLQVNVTGAYRTLLVLQGVTAANAAAEGNFLY